MFKMLKINFGLRNFKLRKIILLFCDNKLVFLLENDNNR